jgi:DNA replication regulator SLD3
MLHSVSKNSTNILGLPAKRDFDSKSQLPSKHKRDSICGLGAFTKPFVIKPCPESLYDKSATFRPIRVIGRAQLPLTFLDTSLDSDFTPNRLFAAHINILERYHASQEEDNSSPRVLIARYETNKTLYAIERVEARVYSLCKLARWLKEKDVTDLWDPINISQYPTIPVLNTTRAHGGEWWQQAAIKLEPEEKPTKLARISMLRLTPKPDPVEPTLLPPGLYPQVGENDAANIAMIAVPEISMEAPSPQQLLENLVQQYLNEIYISKTSLAYFVKGPITRLRTAFTSYDEDSPPTHELVTFLRSMLLSHKAGDKKYRERLPDIIKAIPPGDFSDEEQVDGASKPKKSKKKVKLNREGVYPQEEQIVKKWWFAEMPNMETYGEETIDQRIKRRVGDLRVRETLAQMILMLEVIALETLSTYKEPSDETQPTTGDIKAQEEVQAKPKKRKRKMDDMKLVLDLLLDKLCIWQSVDSDGILDFDAKPSKRDNGTDASSDRLQSFCMEVIIPFYMSRLPEQAIMINKKLGGPANTSPPKRKAMKPPTISRKSGEPKESDAKKPRRTFARVATDTNAITQRRTTPSLNRSTTDSALLNGIKREGSEVPMGAIPFQRSPSNAARQSLSQFKHLKGREIDLTTPSAAVSAKLKQKKRVEEDLKEAITALKKPNRGLAVGGYVDDLEKRSLGSVGRSKKASATRKVKDIQVSATPRGVRRTRDIERTPFHNPFRDQEAPSSSLCIPSSGVRQAVPATVQRTTTRNVEPNVAETPSKPTSREDLVGPARRIIFATPVKGRPAPTEASAIFSTPVKAASPAIFCTPTRTLASSPPIASTPYAPAVSAPPTETLAPLAELPVPIFATPAKRIVEEPPDLFQALGWDDDYDF